MIRFWGMNDTIKTSTSLRQSRILQLLSITDGVSSSEVHQSLTDEVSLVTIKRDLDKLTDSGYSVREGRGPATTYRKTIYGLLYTPYPLTDYLKRDVDSRQAQTKFNDQLFRDFPSRLFNAHAIEEIEVQTSQYRQRQQAASAVIKHKELERFIIELAWKSSAIEGNTYSLLDTEKLIQDGIASPNHSKDEAQMIINHKTALQYVLDTLHKTEGSFVLNRRFVEQVHELLVTDLGVVTGPRKMLVGITGTAYSPLDNQYLITEALESLYKAIAQLQHPAEQALIALAGLSYIQPFEDGNKRTARLISNALLLAHQYAPLSYRSTDIDHYRNAMVLFYEQNSLVAIQDIFIEQYRFSAENYLVT